MKNDMPTQPQLPRGLDTAKMHAFVMRAQTAYGKGEATLEKAVDGRKTLTIEDETFRLTDEFDGGAPFCGVERLIPKLNNRVIWNGYYHGWLTSNAQTNSASVASIFNFLREALQTEEESILFRGKPKHSDGQMTYENILEFGDFACFYGHETIHDAEGELLYYGRYGGGLVDLSEDTGEA